MKHIYTNMLVPEYSTNWSTMLSGFGTKRFPKKYSNRTPPKVKPTITFDRLKIFLSTNLMSLFFIVYIIAITKRNIIIPTNENDE